MIRTEVSVLRDPLTYTSAVVIVATIVMFAAMFTAPDWVVVVSFGFAYFGGIFHACLAISERLRGRL